MIRVYRSEKFYYNGRAVGWVMKCPRCGSSLASGFNEVELISCLLETLVHDEKIDRSFKIYLVNLLRDTKKSLITSETKLGQAYDLIEKLREKLHELQEAKK